MIYLKILISLNVFRTYIFAILWGAISQDINLSLKFIDKEKNLSAQYYKQAISTTHLMPHSVILYPKNNWMFQPDSAQSYLSKTTQI